MIIKVMTLNQSYYIHGSIVNRILSLTYYTLLVLPVVIANLTLADSPNLVPSEPRVILTIPSPGELRLPNREMVIVTLLRLSQLQLMSLPH